MPIKRYLQISKHSALEVKIYVTEDDKSNGTSWFRKALLDEAIALVKPLILPKLREERDAKKKKQPTRDTIYGETFTASVYLQDVQTRHCILETDKQLSFASLTQQRHERDGARVAFRESSPLFVPSQEDGEEEDEALLEGQSKPVLETQYLGFPIYGKSLCLIVKPTAADASTRGGGGATTQQETSLEAWIEATQKPQVLDMY